MVPRVVETHISTLVFVDDLVIKARRPLVTEFLDFSDVEARRVDCEREVELNRRLSPDVYLGVGELRLPGAASEPLVIMARLPDDRRLSRLLGGSEAADLIDAVAEVLAEFHRHALRGPEIERAASADAVAGLWRDGLTQVAYRAHVRMKVAWIRHSQGDLAAVTEVRQLHEICRTHLDAGLVTLTLVGGAPGTGKSTLARELAPLVDAVVLSSDKIRREVVPAVPAKVMPARTDDVHSGRYRDEHVDAVYEAMLERARVLLERGQSVVLDASWLKAGRRRRARGLGDDTASAVVELHCLCDPELAEQRIIDRQRRGTDASQATVAVSRRLQGESEAWPEAVELDTAVPLSASVERATREVLRR